MRAGGSTEIGPGGVGGSLNTPEARGGGVCLYSTNGANMTPHFLLLFLAQLCLPTRLSYGVALAPPEVGMLAGNNISQNPKVRHFQGEGWAQSFICCELTPRVHGEESWSQPGRTRRVPEVPPGPVGVGRKVPWEPPCLPGWVSSEWGGREGKARLLLGGTGLEVAAHPQAVVVHDQHHDTDDGPHDAQAECGDVQVLRRPPVAAGSCWIVGDFPVSGLWEKETGSGRAQARGGGGDGPRGHPGLRRHRSLAAGSTRLCCNPTKPTPTWQKWNSRQPESAFLMAY